MSGPRTDCKIRLSGELRVPQIPIIGAGRPSYVKRGDYLRYRMPGGADPEYWGRVVGFVTADNIKGEHIIIVMMMLGGCMCERWVDPEWVYDTASSDGVKIFREKIEWFYSDDFLWTPQEVARQCYDLTVEQIKAKLGKSE